MYLAENCLISKGSFSSGEALVEVIIRLCFALNSVCMHSVNIFVRWDSLESAVFF